MVDRTRQLARLLTMALLAVAGCHRLESIPYTPTQTPESWLRMQPFTRIALGSRDLILTQPTSTALVYLLGLLAIGIGFHSYRTRKSHRSRLWWAIALLFWGVSALCAGTSYQAFSYEIKCAGRAICSWTSWWEVTYLILAAASVNAMIIAVAWACTAGRWRRGLFLYALIAFLVYTGAVLIGAFTPVPVLISFELMALAASPGILGLFILNARRYYRSRRSMDLALVGTWTGLALTLGVYLLYLRLQVAPALWARGIWFTENDILHLGLIAWMLYIAATVSGRLQDVEPAST